MPFPLGCMPSEKRSIIQVGKILKGASEGDVGNLCILVLFWLVFHNPPSSAPFVPCCGECTGMLLALSSPLRDLVEVLERADEFILDIYIDRGEGMMFKRPGTNSEAGCFDLPVKSVSCGCL